MILRRFLEAPDWRGWLFLAILAAAAVLVPIFNVFVPPSSPFHVTTTAVALWGKYLCYALLALSLDLVWGYCGILSLGHGAFFALGGYAMGMYLMRQIGTRGGYADPVLPDFMMFLNWKQLPWYWHGFDLFPFAALMVLLVPGVLAFVFGWFAFRSRVTGVYLSIITQALTFALMLLFFRNDFGFGGNNGLTDFYDLLGFSVRVPETRAVLFSLSAVALMLGYLIAQAVVRSKAGKVLIAIRDEESRTRFLGYRVENYKTWVFTLSACMAGVAGALYVPQVGIINPSEFAPANSIEVVIWVAVGGRGTLVGAALGGVLVNYAKTIFTGATVVPYWLLGVGVLAVLGGVSIRLREVLYGAIPGALVVAAGWLLLHAVGTPLPPPAGAEQSAAALLETAKTYWPVLTIVLAAVTWLVVERPWPLGAILGVLAVFFFRTPFEGTATAPYWLFVLGAIFVLVTIFLPRGVLGLLPARRDEPVAAAHAPSPRGAGERAAQPAE
jgi:urea transport system permease protein